MAPRDGFEPPTQWLTAKMCKPANTYFISGLAGLFFYGIRFWFLFNILNRVIFNTLKEHIRGDITVTIY